MIANVRWLIAGIAIVVVLGLLDAEADGCGLRGLLFRRRCEPRVVVECIPVRPEPTKEPIKEPIKEPVKKPRVIPVDKDVRVNVKNIAGLLKDGDHPAAQKLARDVAPTIDELSDLMHLYRPRNKGGLGWSSKEQANPAQDGIEKQLFALNGRIKDALRLKVIYSEAEEVGYWIAAMAELTLAKAPKSDRAGKTGKVWIQHATDLRQFSFDLARAGKGYDPIDLQFSAQRITATCAKCHALFKE